MLYTTRHFADLFSFRWFSRCWKSRSWNGTDQRRVFFIYDIVDTYRLIRFRLASINSAPWDVSLGVAGEEERGGDPADPLPRRGPLPAGRRGDRGPPPQRRVPAQLLLPIRRRRDDRRSEDDRDVRRRHGHGRGDYSDWSVWGEVTTLIGRFGARWLLWLGGLWRPLWLGGLGRGDRSDWAA